MFHFNILQEVNSSSFNCFDLLLHYILLLLLHFPGVCAASLLVDDDDEEQLELQQQHSGKVKQAKAGVKGHAAQPVATPRLKMNKNDVMEFLKEVHLPGQPKLYQCSLCGKSGGQRNNMMDHMRARHAAPTHDVCPYCRRIFKNKPSLRNHLTTKRCLKNVLFHTDS